MNTKEFTNIKVLVTGGAGFIGSNLINQLLEQNNTVVCLDNLSTGFLKNINSFLKNKNFKFIEGDIRDYNTCLEASKNVEVIFHQAALGSVPRSIKDPITTNSVNISGFLNMLWATKNNNVKRFIYAASSSTYGDSKELPKVEDNIGNPLSPYAITKYVNELYAKVFADTYGIETIGLRYFNVFGPNQDPNGAYAAVIPKFIKLLLHEQSPTINGDGKHSRDFTYIDNVVKVNILAALVKNKEALNTVYNVACGEQANLLELVNTIKENCIDLKGKTISQIKPLFGPNREGDIKHSLANINKAEKLLKYTPEVKFNEGIKKTISWFLKP